MSNALGRVILFDYQRIILYPIISPGLNPLIFNYINQRHTIIYQGSYVLLNKSFIRMARKKIEKSTPTTSSDAIPTQAPRINADEFTILSQYEKNFNQARSDYLRGIYSRDIETVKPIYERIGYKLSNPNCGGCVLNMFKQLSKEYEIYKEVNG